MQRLIAGLSLLLLAGCGSLPAGMAPVERFDLERYSGTWYEVIRLENRFERGLSRVTAQYTVQSDGSVRVLNRGYADADSVWKEASGKAKFAGASTEGRLKVSFFGPFYAPYIVFDLDAVDYQYAFVSGGERTLWLLARTPTVDDALIERFLAAAARFGYALDELVYVEHGPL
ncbi:MAG: lipocalin family protein [Pseudomonadota bacterium]